MKKIPQGWQCPVCKKVHSPMIAECNCQVNFPEPNIYMAKQNIAYTFETKPKKEQFTPPTYDEVNNYCLERKNNIDPGKWLNFYQAKGWMVGKNKMKDWKAAVRTWEHGNNGYTTNNWPSNSLSQNKIITNISPSSKKL